MVPEKSSPAELAFITFATVVAFSFFGALHFFEGSFFRMGGSTTPYLPASALQSIRVHDDKYVFTCPFSSELGHVVYFESRKISTSNPQVDARDEVLIPAGTYIVSLYTYDAATVRAQEVEERERVFLDIYSGDEHVASVGPSEDLEDLTPVADSVDVLTTNLSVPSPVSHLVARGVEGPGGNVDSLRAGCARFEPMLSESDQSDSLATLTLVSEQNDSRVILSWSEQSRSGAESFEVYRDGILQATTVDRNYTDVNTTPGQTHTYTVVGVDAYGGEVSTSALHEVAVPAEGFARIIDTASLVAAVQEFPEEVWDHTSRDDSDNWVDEDELEERYDETEVYENNEVATDVPDEVDDLEPEDDTTAEEWLEEEQVVTTPPVRTQLTTISRVVTKQDLVVADDLGLEKEMVELDMQALQLEMRSLANEPMATKARVLLGEKRSGRLSRNDSDDDGITDYDEIVLYGSDPFDATTADGSLTDGELLLSGQNIFMPGEALVHEDPRGVDAPSLADYSILNITARSQPDASIPVDETLLLQGTGMRNSFVTVYLFSTPIVVTVRTDENGFWEYELVQELPDGEHEVYIATVNASGNIIARSEAVPFVKEAQAVSFGAGVSANPAVASSQGFFSNNFLLISLLVAVMGFAGAVLVIGARRSKEFEAPEPHQ